MGGREPLVRSRAHAVGDRDREGYRRELPGWQIVPTRYTTGAGRTLGGWPPPRRRSWHPLGVSPERPDTLVVDAPSMVYRAFFALPRSITGPHGEPVNAVRGYLDMLARLLVDQRPAQ